MHKEKKSSKIQIIRDLKDHVHTRSSLRSQEHTSLVFEVELQHIDNGRQNDNWIKVMQEELDQFQKNDAWKLVELPKGNKVVEVKWIFYNKLDENGKVVRNKAWLVAKGYS